MGTYNGYYKINTVDLIDVFYPVGSIYETKDANFDPGTAWGGTWSKIQDKFLVAAGSTYSGTGGAASVTLTTENLPSHRHSFTPDGSVSVSSDPEISYTKTTGQFYGYNYGSGTGGFDGTIFKRVGTTNNMGSGSGIGGARYDFSYTPSGSISGGSYSFSGSAGNTGNTGSGDSFNIIPPYQAVYTWRRTA